MVRRPPTDLPSRARRVLVVGTVAALLATLGAGPAEATTHRTRLLDLVNHSRIAHHLKPVKINLRVTAHAKAHTRQMIRRGRLSDVANLAGMLKPYKHAIGADVAGCGPTLESIHRAFMQDQAHRSIILTRKFRRVGIGVIRVDGKSSCGRNAFWVTEIFYG